MTITLILLLAVPTLGVIVYLHLYLLPRVLMDTLAQDVDGDKLQEYNDKALKLFQAAPPLGDDIMTPLLLAMVYQEALNSEKEKG